jgi:hypothetical protein|tara:strand:- start:7417 stop:7956 length:540 start_codon:yes stop_codon:yes gene_type:complete
MKFEILIFGITGLLMYNTYHDGKYIKLLLSYKKYYTMAMWAFTGLSLYLFLNKYPSKSREMFTTANQFIKMMPIDKEAVDFLSPIFDMTTNGMGNNLVSSQKRIVNSGRTGTKRSVSETKKKFVASNQNWKCGKCSCQLPAWFEVDHKIRLDKGGSNHIDNLVALCRSCHGEKTTMENL